MRTEFWARILRNGEFVNLQIEELTDEELKEFFMGASELGVLRRWCIELAKALRPAPLVFSMGEQTIREMAVELPRQGRLAVTVVTGDQTLRRDETTLVAEELRGIADVYENMSTPEEN